VVQMIDHSAFYDEEELALGLQEKENERRRLSEVRLKTDMDSGATDYEETSDSSTGSGTPQGSVHSASSPQQQTSPSKNKAYMVVLLPVRNNCVMH